MSLRTLTEINAELAKPLHPSLVKERSQGGASLSYMEAHEVIRTMNRAFGPLGWSRRTLTMELVGEQTYQSGRGVEMREVAYTAQVEVVAFYEGGCCLKTGTGSGSGTRAVGKPGLGDLYGFAAKEAESDGMKRACMQLGDSLGLALYDKTKANVRELAVPVEGPLADRIANAQSLEALQAIWGALGPHERAGAVAAMTKRKGELQP